jgi:phosphatidylserine/phosphatidylglycerophosphate/cardiolipin synthase-like enzyme
VAVVVDADDYFRAAREAMLRAERQILLVGWDFDARVRLVAPGTDEGPETLGDFVPWLVRRRPGLHIHLLRWGMGAVNVLLRGTTVFTLMRWMAHRRIHTKLDGAHPIGAAHHQKIVVVDDAIAFCGGIDMTGERWDTREHADADPRRKGPGGRLYGPWHDATTAVQGPVAAALGTLCRARWKVATGDDLPVPPHPDTQPDLWPAFLPVHLRDVDVGISRSLPEADEQGPVREIEALYLDLIASARRVVYAESQYFASRRIAEAIGRRLREPDGPEFVLVNPVASEGWLEPLAMDTARARLHEALRRVDAHGRFRIYHPRTAGGEPIYVHAKVLVVDDRALRVGSSNVNNRSLRMDSECDLTVDARAAADGAAVAAAVEAVRDGLLGEHLGVGPAAVADAIRAHGSLVGAIESLRARGGRTLVPYETPDLNAVEAWLADHEALDPEEPEELFETFTKRSLFQRLRAPSR